MKRALADVLWEAANLRLSRNYCEPPPLGQEEFSCHAVLCAALGSNWRRERNDAGTMDFLESLGCNTMNSGFDSDTYKDPQGVRYMWLLLAMHVAEDEGIEIEVAE